MEKELKLSVKVDSKSTKETIYRQLEGSLIYLTTTRPNLSFEINNISRFMANPKVDYWTAEKRVLRYVKGTMDFGLLHGECDALQRISSTHSDEARSADDQKSTTSYVFNLGTDAVS